MRLGPWHGTFMINMSMERNFPQIPRFEQDHAPLLSVIVCSVAEALQCDDVVSGEGKCSWQALPLQSHHQTYNRQH